MAIAFDASSNSGTTSGISIGTVSHTVGAGVTNGLLAVAIQVRNNTGTTNMPAGTVTYNGVSLTKQSGGTQATAATLQAEVWTLLNPTKGAAKDIVVKWPGNNDWATFGGISLSGVDQGNPIDAFGGTAGTAPAGPFAVNLTTVANNAWIVDSYYNKLGGSTAIVPGASQTAIYTDYPNGGPVSGDQTTSTYKGPFTPAGTTSMSYSYGTTVDSDSALSAVSFKPSPAGTSLIQSTGTANLAAGSTQVTFASNMTANNLIVVGVTLSNALSVGTVSSITDNQSNTYTRAVRGTISEAISVIDEEIWYASKITGGVGTVTVNHTTDNCAVFAREYSGFDTLDVTNSATGSSTTPNSGTVTTTIASELLVVSTGDDKGATQTFTPAGAYGDMVGTTATLTDISMEDNIIGAIGAQTGTLTLGAAANWVSVFASFYKAPSGFLPRSNLLNVG